MKKQNKILSISLIACILIISILLLVVPAKEVLANTNNLYETKEYWRGNIADNYANDSVIVVLDKSISKVNKQYRNSFFGDIEIQEIEDLTYFDKSIEDLKYLNRESFRQILKITLKDKTKENVINVIKKLETKKGIKSVLPNSYDAISFLEIENEEYLYEDQWGLAELGVNAEQAWDITTGSSSVKVGVIDSGVANHEDLNANIATGRDFVNNDNVTNDDVVGHGTHVAGIIGAIGNNGKGIAGVAWDVQIVPLQIADSTGDIILEAIIKAINHAIANNIDILNFSIGLGEEVIAVKNVIANYTGLFVCSAGNKDSDNDIFAAYPSNYSYDNSLGERVISVGAIMENNKRPTVKDWGFDLNGNPQGSNYGATTVSLFAPGSNILSTYPMELCAEESEINSGHEDVGYHKLHGTSMAAPFVAGVAALMLSVNPNLTAQELKAGIMNNVDKVDALEGLCVSGGKLNAFKAVSSVAYDLTNVGTEEIQIDGLKNNLKGSITGELTISDEINGRTVTKIAGNAFAGSSISAINIPKAVNFINNTAFNSCANLSEITIESGNTVYMSQGNCIIRINDNTLIVGCKTSVIPSTVTSIGNNAFYGCSGLTGITIPNSVSSIGDLVFADCTSLGSISIPNNVNNIGSNTFSGCSNLSSVSLPVGLTSISWGMFKNCSKLSSISIPSSVTAIGQDAFYGCSKLSSISIPSAVNSIGSYAFYGCSGLTGFISLPNNVTNIANYTFKDCSKIMGISGANLTFIGNSAFENCTSLIGFVVPESTTGIGIEAFKNCTSLSILTIKSNLLGLGDYAFKGCSSLTSVVIPTGVEYMGVGVFDNCNYLTIYTSYTSAPSGWSSNSGLSPIIGGSDWNIDSRPVFWGCTLRTTSGVPYVYSITLNAIAINGGRIENANAINGISAPTRVGYTFGGWYNNANYTGTALSATGIANYLTGTFYVKWTSSGGILPILSDVEQYELTLEEIAIILGVNLEENY